MSKHAPLPRKPPQSTPSENEFEAYPNQTPSRAPLISITDPSQCQPKNSKPDGNPEAHLVSSLLKTPKHHGRDKSANPESNSAQVTPAASGCTLARFPFNGGGRGAGAVFPRAYRGISTPVPQSLSPHIELDYDPSFWKDHNVQVLIRMRPLNSAEMISQGSQRCLIQESRQTLVWQGHPETRFTFDHIACESISQEKLFRVAGLPMVDNCMSGYNSCMFAYGQTGSGKTYTMMGDIDKMDGKLSDGCGITPRIFEYLFTRITKEEDSRKHERLSYSCKCSFLEIYNEQITDLLEPSSTNLQLREDSKKGIYVENLTEHSVRTVNDVLQLLQQGAANRKIAATHMNSESSRSHSVFTCVVESRWEKDSMAHLRFGRLNLVDLAGSERQKSSGAEGDRLKEAANINKSLSTLGLVIMSLVDLAHGKHRHVPYRDSRLTFLLQDSLGGNSKTTIIANVSPSICSANETLSTLKFAQRAKLIQNNAKINEDASGGVIALQHQVQQLKDQLSFLMKHQHTPVKLTDFVPRLEHATLGHVSESYEPYEEMNLHDEHTTPKEVIVKENYLEGTSHGTLRREKSAETEVRRLKAEIEQLNRLDHQKEEEIQHGKMMLKFREDKIKRLELLLDGLVPAEKFYLDENNALREENLLLREKNSRNLEVNQLTSHNPLADDKNDFQRENIHRQLVDAQCLIEAMKLEQSQLIKELEFAQSENQNLTRMLDTMEVEQRKLEDYKKTKSGSGNRDLIVSNENSKGFGTYTETLNLHTKMEKLSKDLKEAQILNRRFMEDHETRLSQDHQTELICSEVEMETTKTIIQLQEEIDRLNSEFHVCLHSVAEQNLCLRNGVAAKEDELRESRSEWERATLELTMFLTKGSRSLRDASCEIKSITSSFSSVSDWITEQVERAAKKCIEKEETILVLQKSLEDAQNTVMQMEQKLVFLKDATITLCEFQEPEKYSSIGEIQLSGLPNGSTGAEEFTENKSKSMNGQITENQTNTHIFVNDRISDYASVVGNPSLACANAPDGKPPQHDEIQFSSGETANILSLLEECFLEMQTSMEELSQTTCTDAIQVGDKTLTLFCILRSSLEDLICKAIQNDISTFVIQCQMREFFHKVGRLNTISNPDRLTLQEHYLVADDLLPSHLSQDDNSALQPVKSESKGPQVACSSTKEKCMDLLDDGGEYESSELMRELSRRDVLLQGLLFDFSLLQEFASHRKDIKDELEKLIDAMSKVQHELRSKSVQLDDVLIKNRKLEGFFSEAEKALLNSNSELNILSEQNVELNDLLQNLYRKNSEAEQLLEDQKEAIKCLEREIIRVSSLREKQLASSVDGIEEALAEVVAERDKLVETLTSLQDKLDMASALVDENQALADEARQESETSKVYAEEKEEEVRILEHSIQELESTINVLENKVHEMEEEVEKQGKIRDSLELVIQSLRHRLLTVEDFTESMTSDTSTSQSKGHLSRSLEIKEAHCRIGFLEEENGKQAMEIRQYKDYISELVLHADAQASQYQQKYKTLEAMLHEIKTDTSNVSTAPALDKSDKISARTRGSGSPFRCIAGVVQQINQEKDRELSSARLRIEGLEALAASRYKEVCMLNTKLATAESMTHDVIRDLLSVKLDISNYANIVDNHELEKLVVEAQHHREDFVAMEQEIFYLRTQIENLLEDRERCISEINRCKSDQLTTQIALEQLQERDQMLISQNDMLKTDKHNLQRRVAELDEMVKKLFSMQQDSKRRNQQQVNSSLSRPFEYDIGGSLTHQQRAFLRMNNRLDEGVNEVSGNGTRSKR